MNEVKTHLISTNDSGNFQSSVNAFIAGKEIIDIKYNPVVIPTRANVDTGGITAIEIIDRCLIIYREG